MFSDVLPMPEVAIFVNVKSSILSVCVLGGGGDEQKAINQPLSAGLLGRQAECLI